MKVSVIVPIYNVEGYLHKCIESIMNQDYKNLEIILVDDGSTDDSGIICDNYAKKDSRIITIHQSNTGVVSARKAGGQIATGEYIVSVDGDDWIDKGYVESFVKLLHKDKNDVVWSISYYKEKSHYSELLLVDIGNDIQSNDCQRELLKRVSGEYGFQNDIEYSLGNKFIQRDIYNTIQNRVDDNLTRGEDLYFSVALLASTNNILFCRNDGYHYVHRETSNTNNKSGYTKERFHVLKVRLKELSECLAIEKKMLNNIINGYLLSTYMLYFFGTEQDKKIDYLFPFKTVKKHSRVIIYGAGSIGINIISYLNSVSDYKIVMWIDSEMVGKKIGERRIGSVEEIIGLQYDYIILATNRTKYIGEMRNNLKQFGIQDKKIRSAFDSMSELGS